MLRRFRLLFNDKPLQVALFCGMTARLLAAFFSAGYGMHDDHFLVIETAGSWLAGHDYNNWLPSSAGYIGPQGHSLFYPGIIFCIMWVLKQVHVTDPQTVMLVIRLIHAAYSLLIISGVFYLARRFTTERRAGFAALFIALLWFFPNLSVRNLVEMVCIPPLLASTLYFLDGQKKKHWGWFLISGAFIGLALAIRYQTALFALGMGLILLFNLRIKDLVVFTLSTALVFTITQLPDVFIHHQWFGEFLAYVKYNISARDSYVTSPWYTYFLTVSGLLIPPISLFLLFGFFKGWKKGAALFFPALLFLVFHSMFPNKQERFILPAIPYIIALGYPFWAEWRERSVFWQGHKKLLHGCWNFFWVLNIMALLVVSTSYSKRSRVETMYTLYKQGDLKAFIIDRTQKDDIILPPQFYSGNWNHYYIAVHNTNLVNMRKSIMQTPDSIRPNYVIFAEDDDLKSRVDTFSTDVATVTPLITEKPSNLDRLLHWLNPRNRIEHYHIYKIDHYLSASDEK